MKAMATDVSRTPHTWEDRLSIGQLSEEEWQVLHDMIDSGEVETVEEGARLLDFKERDLNQRDSFYGF